MRPAHSGETWTKCAERRKDGKRKEKRSKQEQKQNGGRKQAEGMKGKKKENRAEEKEKQNRREKRKEREAIFERLRPYDAGKPDAGKRPRRKASTSGGNVGGSIAGEHTRPQCTT